MKIFQVFHLFSFSPAYEIMPDAVIKTRSLHCDVRIRYEHANVYVYGTITTRTTSTSSKSVTSFPFASLGMLLQPRLTQYYCQYCSMEK
jgi:hypothetical protein